MEKLEEAEKWMREEVGYRNNLRRNSPTEWYYDSENFKRITDYFAIAADAIAEKLKREEGCEWCEDIGNHSSFGYATLETQTSVDDFIERTIKIRFCPNCGKRLGGE